MNSDIAPDHPRLSFLFYLAEDPTPQAREQVATLVAKLTGAWPWVLGPPVLVDRVDEASGSDAAVETLGGALEIYSALPPHGLPMDVDRKHLEEVEAIVAGVRELSQRAGLAFEFELGGTFVGAIENGVIDRTLQSGLLDEWRTHLGAGQS